MDTKKRKKHMDPELLIEAKHLHNQYIAITDQLGAHNMAGEIMQVEKRRLEQAMANNAEQMTVNYQRRSS